MKDHFYETEIPGWGTVNGYVHQIYGYRYNWHDNHYEINVVIRGKLEFFAGGKKHLLGQDDLILVEPGIGHASYPLEPDTATLVIHFPAWAFCALSGETEPFSFQICSQEESRYNPEIAMVRFCCSRLLKAISQKPETWDSRLAAKAALGMLMAHLYCSFPRREWAKGKIPQDEKLMNRITTYIAENYKEKLRLQDIAEKFGYNRTYISTLFKQNLGIGFHDYLNRHRFQKALLDLGNPEKNLLDVALDHGFTDLNTFNQMFRDNFGTSPKNYRERMERELAQEGLIPHSVENRIYLDIRDPAIWDRISEYGCQPQKGTDPPAGTK